MAAIRHSNDLINRLPKVRGQLTQNVELAKLTWFRVGGPAEVLYRPADEADLIKFLKGLPTEIPVTILGVGSNILVRDGGIPGVSIRLGSGFHHISICGKTVTVGAGTPNLKLANAAREEALAGMEFLCGIPGTLGGSIRMNSGAYNSEIKDLLESVRALSNSGEEIALSAKEMKFSYRHAGVSQDLIFVEARLNGQPGDRARITEKMAQIQSERKITQPAKQPTGGSTFTNPWGRKAWELIDKAGCRGLTRGDAQVSNKHCNFLINLGKATAADLEGLGEDVRMRVYENSGIKLEWEIKRIGDHEKGVLREVGL